MSPPPTARQTFVIVGASLAGDAAAATLREEGFAGRVVLVGAEPERPYERPPLSKDFLRGESARARVFLRSEGFYAEQDLELRLGRAAVALDLGSSEVELDDGDRLRYDRLLLATGAEPRRLPIAGATLDGVVTLRSLADAEALRERLEHAGRVVVVGAGWIGTEVAASARQLGVAVTLVDPLAVPLERVLGVEVGTVYRDLHADHGVDLRLGTGVTAFEGAGRVERVRLGDGSTIDADVVVVGVGVTPRIALAAGAGLAVGDGVHVDEHLATSHPGVHAAGDIAAVLDPRTGERLRVEHWANALHQGPVAARTMLGRPAVCDRVPYFFSDQYDVGMEYSGIARPGDRVVFRGDPATREFVAFWLRGERVVAGMNVNVWGVADAIAELVRAGTPVDPRRLADADVPLDALATPV
jgi:3-phenylpropionate/trans-cinnamate dioxygenase ferredoxin reductase subunit